MEMSVTTSHGEDQVPIPSTVVGENGRSVTTLNQSDQISFLSALALDEKGRSVTTPNQTDGKPFVSALVGKDDYLADITLLPQPPSDIPDGGLQAYLQVLGAHFLIFNSWYSIPPPKSCPSPFYLYVLKTNQPPPGVSSMLSVCIKITMKHHSFYPKHRQPFLGLVPSKVLYSLSQAVSQGRFTTEVTFAI